MNRNNNTVPTSCGITSQLHVPLRLVQGMVGNLYRWTSLSKSRQIGTECCVICPQPPVSGVYLVVCSSVRKFNPRWHFLPLRFPSEHLCDCLAWFPQSRRSPVGVCSYYWHANKHIDHCLILLSDICRIYNKSNMAASHSSVSHKNRRFLNGASGVFICIFEFICC